MADTNGVRYVTQPATSNWWEAKATDYLTRTVHEEEAKPIDGGLLDASGAKLYKVQDKQPVGFVRHPSAS